MTGRGRGRGRGQLSFNMEVVGIGKGENLPPSTLQPTPLFPPMEHKPVPLVVSEEAEYMLALKQEFRGAMKTLPFYIKPAAPKKDVERYSDKYQSSETNENPSEWDPDWKRLPKELRTRTKRLQKEKSTITSKQTTQPRINKEEIIRTLEIAQTLEKKEEAHSSDEEDGEKKKQEEEAPASEEEYNEEEFEEETDYIMSYFDNGEEFGGDSDDNIDEAVY
ncbi:RNA polymerase III subunit GL b isoform X1 [Clupea harengus]|uniref:RNA polymerase III subunit GL b isoform X1 n=2 Tax=Clupea harengus TaxID=7950 RepID=A0A6P8G9Z1_CLUHA|nr:RNA polymerase III subunit GL b isoform X1 [Clupea harengus]